MPPYNMFNSRKIAQISKSWCHTSKIKYFLYKWSFTGGSYRYWRNTSVSRVPAYRAWIPGYSPQYCVNYAWWLMSAVQSLRKGQEDHGFEVILLHIGSLGQPWGHPSLQKYKSRNNSQRSWGSTSSPCLELSRVIFRMSSRGDALLLTHATFPTLVDQENYCSCVSFQKCLEITYRIWSHFSRHWRL